MKPRLIGEFFALFAMTVIGFPLAVMLHILPILIEAVKYEGNSVIEMWQSWYEENF